MCLLVPPPMTYNRFGQTNRTLPDGKFCAGNSPVALALENRKWDKDNHTGVKALPGVIHLAMVDIRGGPSPTSCSNAKPTDNLTELEEGSVSHVAAGRKK
jgi:hypothetical protein